MNDADRIDLAHAPGFTLGRLAVRPGTRELARDDAETEILEPRVMQVLVALARADGAIVTRDELSRWCWDGRVVGEDAINRVISRLRRSAETIGKDSFAIETITKVGYRLLHESVTASEPTVFPVAPTESRMSRRTVIAGSAAATAAAAAAVAVTLLWPRRDARKPPPEVEYLFSRAMIAMRQETPESNMQATGMLRRVVEVRPDFADGWGALGLAYGWVYFGRGAFDPGAESRARAAIARARKLDPHNPYATQAELLLQPLMGKWTERDRVVRDALRLYPDFAPLHQSLGWVLAQTGQWAEAVAPFARVIELDPGSPGVRYLYACALWTANRLEEADAAIDAALKLFPGYFAIWFGRFYLSLYTGRIAQAIAFAEDASARPTGIPTGEFDRILVMAHAMLSRAPAEIDAAMKLVMEAAHKAAGQAENAMGYACAFGRLDTAFELADALFFARGFDPGEVRFSVEQGSYTPHRNRRTHFLFLPQYAPMRADPRFERLVDEIGLARYWKETGVQPDYRVRN